LLVTRKPRVTSSKTRLVRFECKLGEAEPRMGPNGLERKKGGNDAGKPCIDFEKGKCPRNKCSFKHAKGDPAEEE
jgi:hypothetical protein